MNNKLLPTAWTLDIEQIPRKLIGLIPGNHVIAKFNNNDNQIIGYWCRTHIDECSNIDYVRIRVYPEYLDFWNRIVEEELLP